MTLCRDQWPKPKEVDGKVYIILYYWCRYRDWYQMLMAKYPSMPIWWHCTFLNIGINISIRYQCQCVHRFGHGLPMPKFLLLWYRIGCHWWLNILGLILFYFLVDQRNFQKFGYVKHTPTGRKVCSFLFKDSNKFMKKVDKLTFVNKR